MLTRFLDLIWAEGEMTAVRSGGPGGQHVNKTSSAIQLKFSIVQSAGLTEEEKAKLLTRLSHRLVQNEFLMVRSEEERDQRSNKFTAVKRLADLIATSLIDPKKRMKTKIPRVEKVKRRVSKLKRSETKRLRTEKF